MTDTQFKNTYSVRLNPQQEAAVRQVDGPVLLLAVPGSGKIDVLVLTRQVSGGIVKMQ